MRRFSMICLAVLAALLLGSGALWWWATGRVAAETELWVAARRSEGWRVAMGAPEREGWPLSAHIRLRDVVLHAPVPAPVGMDFGAGEVTIGVAFLHPRTLQIRPQGTQHVRVGAGPDLGFTTVSHVFTTELSDEAPSQDANVAIEGLLMQAPGAAGPLSVGHILARITMSGAAMPQLALKAERIGLPASPVATALGAGIDSMMLDAALTGDIATTLSAWRDSQGSLAVRQFSLDWGRLSVKATADLRLDARMQPSGRADASLVGVGETMDALSKAGLILPRAAMAAKAVLALLERPQPNGPAVVQLPLTLDNRTLQLGRIPLAQMPDIAW